MQSSLAQSDTVKGDSVRAAVCLIVKNEEDYILEWILHYAAIGFDTAIIYDNGSSDRTAHIIRECSSFFDCRYTFWTPGTHDPQIDAYNDCVARFGSDFDWIAFFDIDEILVPVGPETDFKNTLARFHHVSAIGIHWLMFGSNGLDDKGPMLMMEAFTRRADFDFSANRNTKAVMRPRDLVAPCNNPHWFPVSGSRVNLAGESLVWCESQEGITEPDKIHHGEWRLHHYYTRGKRKWLARLARGQFGGLVVHDEHFVPLDRNDFEDNSAKRSAARVRQAMLTKPKRVIIQNVFSSKLGNMMMKYMAAVRLASCLDNAVISGYVLPEWGIDERQIENLPAERSITLAPSHREMEVNCSRAMYLAKSGLIDRIYMEGHVQRIENFPSLDRARSLFMDCTDFGIHFPEYVVCPIRGAEILDAIHPGYTLLPIRFYQEILAKLGKPPLFIGQVGDDLYSEALRSAFPDALFRPNAGAMQDFATIRRASAVIVSISTFSWLAAWLSHANTIILPCFGLFNRDRFPDHDLLPLGDERYQFYNFSIQDAVPLHDLAASHADVTWHQISPEHLLKSN